MSLSKTSLRLRTFTAPLVMLALSAAQPASAQTTGRPDAAPETNDLYRAHLSVVRDLYGTVAWPKGERREGIALASLSLEGWSGGRLSSSTGLIEREFAPTDRPDQAMFVVQARVSETPQAAHEQLVRWLGGLSSPVPAPSASERGYALGDAGYLGISGAGPIAYSWVAFVRGNVAVRLLSSNPLATPDLDLPGIALQLDQAIDSGTVLRVGANMPRPSIELLDTNATAIHAGDAVPLRVRVIDPRGAEPGATLHWTILGPGQGYVEARDGAWFLFTTGEGPVTVSLEAVGAMGTSTTKTLQLAIADER